MKKPLFINRFLMIFFPHRYNHEIPGMVSGKFEKMIKALEEVKRRKIIKKIS